MEEMFAKLGAAFVFAALTTILGSVLAMLAALPVMLALGAVHSDVTTRVPALGYWTTMVILWGLGVIMRYIYPSAK